MNPKVDAEVLSHLQHFETLQPLEVSGLCEFLHVVREDRNLDVQFLEKKVFRHCLAELFEPRRSRLGEFMLWNFNLE